METQRKSGYEKENKMKKIMGAFLMYMMSAAGVMAVIGINACFLFLGDADRDEDVTPETGRRYKDFMKDLRK